MRPAGQLTMPLELALAVRLSKGPAKKLMLAAP
jgi:hypothetical protein